jgi:DNA topoisomerase-3
VSEILSKNEYTKGFSKSKYNPVFSFPYELDKKQYEMNFTSVTGHLMNYDFPNSNEKWQLDQIEKLYDTEMIKYIKEGSESIQSNLEYYAK